METFDGADAEIVANVTMWEPVGLLERAERDEEPLAAALEAAGRALDRLSGPSSARGR